MKDEEKKVKNPEKEKIPEENVEKKPVPVYSPQPNVIIDDVKQL